MTQALSSRQMVLLDRDGTIIIDRDYLDDPEQIEFAAGVIDGLKLMKSQGCRFVVITNQSGVGRGLFSLERLEQIHNRMRSMLRNEGIELDGIYFCPHIPNEQCGCRKPEIGMITRAAAELNFEPSLAIMIGDKVCDVECGRRAGATTILIDMGSTESSLEDSGLGYRANGLGEAAQVVCHLLAQKAAGGSKRARGQ